MRNLRFTWSNDNGSALMVSTRHGTDGHSLIEVLIVVAMISVLIAFALPQLIAARRLSRSFGITLEILAQLRHTRQLAMSERQAFTFQYDNSSKQISIIDHNSNTGSTLFVDPSYPNTAGSSVVSVIPLAPETQLSAEMTYGIPAGLPNQALGDGIAMTPLFHNQLNITFQPDGSVIDSTGNPIGRALFIYNNRASRATASAISVLGASGRVRVWRYHPVDHLYAE